MKTLDKKLKILMLGGSHFQVPAIQYARNAGYHVITCDYLPSNPGHKYAHEYYNLSTTDREGVLDLAKKLQIDGIVAYASDPSAPTAAYVAEKLDLPGNPYQSVKILTEKDLFRKFLRKNGFNSPRGKAYQSYSELEKEALQFRYPVIVKPVDSSGSKGVNRVFSAVDLKDHTQDALQFSRCKRFLVEEFIQRKYAQLDGDIYVHDGKIIAYHLGDQGNDLGVNPFVPSSINYPSLLPQHLHQKIEKDLQRLIDLLQMKFGGFNIEILIDPKDDVYILEVGPRNGGNCIPDIIKYACGLDMIKLTVDGSLGVIPNAMEQQPIVQFYTTYVVHSQTDGTFQGVEVDEDIKPYLIELRLFVQPGDEVRKFMGSNCTLGIALLNFPDQEVRDQYMNRIKDLINVQTKSLIRKV